jgi:uncharacterized protein involved in cysteine biosynthesis
VSSEHVSARAPFPYASDYEASDTESIPMFTPFQRYVLEGLEGVKKGQSELKSSVDALVPRVTQLEAQAQWWKKAVALAKYALPALVLQFFPALGKYVPAIVDAIGKVQP